MKLVVHFDGGSRGNPGPAGAGVVIEDPQGQSLYEAGFFLGPMTNNMAEYHGLLRGLEAAARGEAREVTIFADSELVVRQLNGDYRVKNERLRDLFDAALALLRKFERWTIKHIPREANHRADELANTAMDAGEDVVVIDAFPRAGKTGETRPAETRKRGGLRPAAKSPTPAPADAAGTVVARCTTAPRASVCSAPCKAGTEFIFEHTVPPGLCLGLAVQVLQAVEAVSKSGKPVKVVCPRDGCGACLEVKMPG